MAFNEIKVCDIKDNFIKMIRDDWALLTAGEGEDFNTMTVSWGAVGELWGKDVAIVFVRPQRYTYEFMEKSDSFTLSFFGGEKKKELGVCGSKSGRDIDKVEATGLTPADFDGAVGFDEAAVVLKCKKMAFSDMNPEGFLSPEIASCYAAKDYHRIYVGEIQKTYKKV